MGIITKRKARPNSASFTSHVFYQPSLKSHTLPQLPLPLPRLQLQPANSITQSFLLLPQLAHLQLLQTAQTAGGALSCAARSLPTAAAAAWSCGFVKTTLLQVSFGNEGLFPSSHFLKVRFDACEEGVEFGFE